MNCQSRGSSSTSHRFPKARWFIKLKNSQNTAISAFSCWTLTFYWISKYNNTEQEAPITTHGKRLPEFTWYSALDSHLNYVQFWPKTLVRIWLEFVPSAWKTPHQPPFFPVLSQHTTGSSMHFANATSSVSRPWPPNLETTVPSKLRRFFLRSLCGTPSQLYHCGLLCTELLLCKDATSQEFVQQNSEMIKEYFSALLIKAAQSSQKGANQPNYFLTEITAITSRFISMSSRVFAASRANSMFSAASSAS